MEDELKDIELSIILPCRNEEEALDYCLNQIKEVVRENDIRAEIIVSDSSIDSSPDIARKHQVKLVKHDKEGYGIAYLEGFYHTRGTYVFLADCDGTYDFHEIPRFLKYLREGYDFVLGDRFKNKMDKGAMSFSHKYIGNPILSGIFRFFFHSKVHDVHCGMRALSKSALDKLNLRTVGMEFASEMVIKAVKNNLKIKELPISYSRRIGQSKLSSIPDAWRHLRFMLIYSPVFLFFIPGVVLLMLGLLSMVWIYVGAPEIFGKVLVYHPLFLSSLLIIVGYQLVIFSAFAKTYLMVHLGEESRIIHKLHRYITIERASLLGIFVCLIGAAIFVAIFLGWAKSDFGSLNQVKNSILALTLMVFGIQTIFSSFILSILGIKEK